MNQFYPGWYVAYTKPRHERKVVSELHHLNLPTFLPTVKRLSNRLDRKKYIDAPLFPSYVFINLSDGQGYFSSLDIHGLLHYVRNGKEVARINECVIESIRLAIDSGKDNIEVSSEYFRPGRKFYISEGPFVGFGCEVIHYKGKQKVLARIELLQRSVLFDVPAEYLLPAYAMQGGQAVS